MKKFYLLILICLPLKSISQTTLDSLWNIWEDESLHDTIRLDAINDYAWDGFLFTQPDSTYYYSQIQFDYAKQKGIKSYMAKALNTQGASFWVRSEFPEAIDYFTRSLEIFKEIGDMKGVAASYNNIGNIFYSQGNLSKSLTYYRKSLLTNEKTGDKKVIANALSNIGNIYTALGNDDEGLKYYYRSLAIDEKIGQLKGISNSLINIGNTYNKQGKFKKALECYNRSLKIVSREGDKSGIAITLFNIGLNFHEQKQYDSALVYFNKSLIIGKEIDDKLGVANTLHSIGTTYTILGNHSKGILYCEKSFSIAAMINAMSEQHEACICLYDAYKASGQQAKALIYHEKMLAISDSINKSETMIKIQQMEFEKEMLADSLSKVEEDKLIELAHEAEMRKKNITKNYALGIGAFILLLATGLWGRLRLTRKAKAAVEKEKNRSDDLLLNILPAEIAAELKEKGKAEAQNFEMVSILFTDFKEFTQTSEKLSAQELVAEINTCFEAFDKICAKYNIEKIKTIGDAYMAAGGLPVPTEDSVKNTVLAAIEMQAFMGTAGGGRQAEEFVGSGSRGPETGNRLFEMRVGIHTGPVVAGIVGVKKFQYDIWGDTVNTASRAESESEVGKVNITAATYDLIKDDPQFSFESRGKISAKGKGKMEMFFVSLNRKDAK